MSEIQNKYRKNLFLLSPLTFYWLFISPFVKKFFPLQDDTSCKQLKYILYNEKSRTNPHRTRSASSRAHSSSIHGRHGRPELVHHRFARTHHRRPHRPHRNQQAQLLTLPCVTFRRKPFRNKQSTVALRNGGFVFNSTSVYSSVMTSL